MDKYRGGCHCGAVEFEFEAPANPTVYRCNCSICRMTDFLHLIVPSERFHLLEGENSLSKYRFNTGVAQHLFCSKCGIKSFYIPRSNPDGISVNYRCVEGADSTDVKVENFDGQNWESNASALSHLS